MTQMERREVRALTRAELVAGAVVAVLAVAGAVSALSGSWKWALALLCLLVASIGLFLVACRVASRRRSDLIVRKIDRIEADLRGVSSMMTRSAERLRTLDMRSADLGEQAGAQSRQLEAGFADVRGIAERAQHIARDLYDLRLVLDDLQVHGRQEEG
ncbi:hypothetical protein Q9R19_02085 [Microbacterium sp. ARD32]|uniref:hypothetical protein n=1 Tax=Microbacterium sp. ARD32 TaxID=2962577 RepID=UPI0028827473|nr:hypothetical protein [Microbacterium sp. ARD32]MDT0156406.1 hypothetical protein [Microbacterium sp. ARD32]